MIFASAAAYPSVSCFGTDKVAEVLTLVISARRRRAAFGAAAAAAASCYAFCAAQTCFGINVFRPLSVGTRISCRSVGLVTIIRTRFCRRCVASVGRRIALLSAAAMAVLRAFDTAAFAVGDFAACAVA